MRGFCFDFWRTMQNIGKWFSIRLIDFLWKDELIQLICSSFYCQQSCGLWRNCDIQTSGWLERTCWWKVAPSRAEIIDVHETWAFTGWNWIKAKVFVQCSFRNHLQKSRQKATKICFLNVHIAGPDHTEHRTSLIGQATRDTGSRVLMEWSASHQGNPCGNANGKVKSYLVRFLQIFFRGHRWETFQELLSIPTESRSWLTLKIAYDAK